MVTNFLHMQIKSFSIKIIYAFIDIAFNYLMIFNCFRPDSYHRNSVTNFLSRGNYLFKMIDKHFFKI